VGAVERVNRLISVKAIGGVYYGEVGDIVVGRITKVMQKRWKVDINSRLDGILLLSSINLPTGELVGRHFLHLEVKGLLYIAAIAHLTKELTKNYYLTKSCPIVERRGCVSVSMSWKSKVTEEGSLDSTGGTGGWN